MVELLFNPIDEAKLNADERTDLAPEHADGNDHFTVADERLEPLLDLPPATVIQGLETDFLPVPTAPAFRASLSQFITAGGTEPERLRRLRRATMTLLQSPEYQLC